MTDRRAILIVTALSLALFVPYLLRGHGFLGASEGVAPPWTAMAPLEESDASATDALIYTWPNLLHWRDSIRHDLRGLLWNPAIFCGTPFLAAQDTFALYPTNALVLFLPPGAFFLAVAALHVLIANLGAYAALRRVPHPPFAALLGALAFGASPWFLAHLDILNFPQAAAWLPWIVFFTDRSLVERRARDRAGLALVVALSIFGGMIQVTLLSLITAAILAVVRMVATPLPRGRAVASATIGVFLGLLLAGPQLFPLLEHAAHARRLGTSAADALRFAHRPGEWWQLLYPEILGTPADLACFARPETALVLPGGEADYPPARAASVRTAGTFTESVCGPGVVTLALALAALVGRGRRRAIPFVALIVLGALAAADTPVSRAWHALPGLAFGNPERWLLLCVVGFAGCAAAGAAQLAALTTAGRTALSVPAVALGGLALFITLAPATLANWIACRAGVDPASCAKLPVAMWQQAAPYAMIAGLVAVTAWWRRGTADTRAGALAMLAAACAVWFNLRQNPGQPERELFPSTQLTRYLAARAGRTDTRPADQAPALTPFRIARFRGATDEVPAPLPPNSASVFGIADTQGYEGIVPPRYEDVVERLEPGVVHEHHMIQEWRDAAVLRKPLLDFLGVRFVLSAHHEVPGLPVDLVVADEKAAVFENWQWRPLASAVRTVRTFDDDAAVLLALGADSFAPATEVLIARQDLPAAGIATDSCPEPTVRSTRQGAGAIDLAWDGPLPGPITVAEAFAPGWRAETLDARPVPLLRANHAFMAVIPPADVRYVRLRYQPFSLTLGAALAGLGVLAIVLGGIVRPQRRPSESPG